MLMAGDTSNLWSPDAGADNDAADLCIDIDELFEIMGEKPGPSQNSPEDLSFNVFQGSLNVDGQPSSRAEFSESIACSLSYHSEASDSRTGVAASSSDSAGNSFMFDSVKLESSSNFGSPANSFSGSLNDWIPVKGQGHFCTDGNSVCPNTGSTSQEDNTGTLGGNNTSLFSFKSREANHVIDNRETPDSSQVKHEAEFQFRHLEGDTYSEYLSHNRMMTEEKSKAPIASTKEEFSMMETDVSLYGASHAQPTFSEIYSVFSQRNNQYSDMYLMNKDNQLHAASLGQYATNNFNFQSFSNNDDKRVEMKERTGSVEAPEIENCDVIDLNAHYNGGCDPSRSGLPFALSSSMFHANEDFGVEEINDKLVTSQDIASQFSEVSGLADEFSTNEGCISTISLTAAEKFLPFQSDSVKQQLDCVKVEREGSPNLRKNIMHSSKSHHVIQKISVGQRYLADDNADVCILEDISDPAHCSLSTIHGKSLVVSNQPAFSKSFNPVAVGYVRHKANDERLVFRAALQGLSQPKAEDTPPDGVLAVPLLRHQRIALSWMIKKEKYGDPCTGGILADDQGLGKTVSTIALILKERSPSSAVSVANIKQTEAETLNLDEDDEDDSDSSQANSNFMKGGNTSMQPRGRLAAGTLIVCPTSVLRQWYEELHNKVTSQANLSVLVYHGSSRTKDSSELAKYDVVLTTYSIVSMEVPKQPIVDEEDDETGERGGEMSVRLSSSRKRKYPPSSCKRSLKGKKGMEGELLEDIASPLAKVGWFRVVLDEAQSIKNHRTQVARACWGLRAKRRWCLSGTPIQNAVDDLYSYFRFLRFDPYLKYKSFCSTIKVPIQRNPANGYRKLQAVLKTIMLRRTKGTLLDGEPIINLPPKTIELRKVDFTEEERDFYCRLEADSRAQFAEYAAAGTVKQNYVNILLMLLRLRQACDHPLLIKGYTSKSMGRSFIEMAKKLPRERQICLLNCLEASQAICGICSDPPEDAIVTTCGHVFCNQCISEHLTGDDKLCPTTNCKIQLNTSSIFSIQTLRSCLSDQPILENIDSCGSELAETSNPFTPGYDSSKIKAALEVLQSLSRPRISNTRTSSIIRDEAASTEKLPHSCLTGFHRIMGENKVSDVPGSSSDITVVAGEKAIVFSQWTRMLDLLEVCLKNSSIQYRRLDGTMSVVARDKAVKDFNTLPEVSVMIMSLKAASLGLNMVAACHVLLLDLWWNPTTEDQAIDRAHRIGQTRPVTVVRLTVKDTVEDRILALQQKKREMVASAFGEDETGSRQTRLTVEDLTYLFGDVPR